MVLLARGAGARELSKRRIKVCLILVWLFLSVDAADELPGPVASANDVEVFLPTNEIRLIGDNSTGKRLNYVWRIKGGGEGWILENSRDANAILSSLSPGKALLGLTVTDEDGNEDEREILVTVRCPSDRKCPLDMTMIDGECEDIECPPPATTTALGCQGCPKGSFRDGNTCECREGYGMLSGVCFKTNPCPANSQRSGPGECACVVGYENIGTKENVKCAKECRKNETRNNSTKECECDRGFEDIRGQCLEECVDPSKMSRNNRGDCECKSGMELWNGKDCKDICPSGSNRDANGDCNCPNGQEVYKGACVKKCPTGGSRDRAGNCKCPGGKEAHNNQCTDVCPKGAARNANGKCNCPNGQEDYKGSCVEICPKGATRDANGKCNCPNGQEAFKESCVKQCPTGGSRNGAGNCKCPGGKEVLNNQCTDVCPKGATRDGDGKCNCPDGQEAHNGACVKICMKGATRNANGKCNCPDGQEAYKESCVAKCPTGATRDGDGKCNCPTTQEVYNGACVNKCLGKNKERVSDGSCGCTSGYKTHSCGGGKNACVNNNWNTLDQWTSVCNKAYIITSQNFRKNYIDAQTWCKQQGGFLAEPVNSTEANCLLQKAKAIGTYPQNMRWIGYKNPGAGNSRAVTTADGRRHSSAINNLWGPKEPNSGAELCIHTNRFNKGLLNDINCGGKYAIICEMKTTDPNVCN